MRLRRRDVAKGGGVGVGSAGGVGVGSAGVVGRLLEKKTIGPDYFAKTIKWQPITDEMAFQKSWNKDHEVRLMGKRERAKEKEQEIKVDEHGRPEDH